MTRGALKNLGCFLLSVILVSAVTPGRAEVYKYEDAEGRIYLTDRPMKGGYRLLWRSGPDRRSSRGASSVRARQYQFNKARFSPMIQQVAERTELRPELLHAVVRAESAYDPAAVSSAGAVGLMQLMPDTAKRYGVRDRRDPESNLTGGARYLRDLMRLFDHDLSLALAAYNAGENVVVEYGNRIPPFAETQRYVAKVLRFYRQYQ